MQVPLSVEPTVKFGKEKLNIWHDRKQALINAPILPYFYSYEKLDIPEAKISQVRAKALSSFKERTFYKYEFESRQELVDARNKIRDERGRGVTFEDNIPFVIRNRIDNPELFLKYPHKKELTFHHIDIEQYIKPGKPAPELDDRITAISWAGNDRKVKSIFLGKDSLTDKKLLQKYLELNPYQNIDVLTLYNKTYDMPTIINRCNACRIDITKFSKNGVKPSIGGEEGTSIEGITIYDIYDSASGDQSLTGYVPNRGLKAVSDHFKFKGKGRVLTKEQMIELIGTKDLVEYNKDDVKRLMLLFDIYWGAIEYKAEALKIPLNLATNLSMTDLGLVVLGDLYREHNIIADGENWSRYPEIFQREKDKHEPNFQGALVDIKRTGVFEKVKKADYSSMYPNIAMTFNLGPDTTTLLEYKPYGKFKIIEEENWFIYEIPDDVLKKNICIQVMKKPGFLAKKIEMFLKARAHHKKLAKELDSKAEKAKSDTYKVFANGSVGYGIHGAAHHPFGFAPMAIATTGFGRQCAQLLIDILEELYSKSVIEIDTDGVYFYVKEGYEFNKKKVIEAFNNRIVEKFKRPLNLSIDIDEYPKGYFYAMKNYVLVNEKGELIFHGGAFKSSRQCNMSKKLKEEIAWAKLDKKDERPIIDKYRKLDFELEDFAMNVKMGQHPNQYSNQTGFVMSLARQAEAHFGIKPRIGNQYYYVKSYSGYKLLELASKDDLDTNYYQKEIDKVIKMFDISPATVSIDKWL